MKTTLLLTLLLFQFSFIYASEAIPVKEGFEGPLFADKNCKLGVTVYHQNQTNDAQIILHAGMNQWKMLSNGAIVLKDNPTLGLTVRHQEITNDTKIILHEGYNLWKVLSNGAIVLKDNPRFGLTVRHQEMKNNTILILHEGYNTWYGSCTPDPSKTPVTNEPSVPLFVVGGGGLGITVKNQEVKNGAHIILHEGLNHWIMRPNGAIVLRDNPKYGLTVLNQNITNDAQIILHEGYNLWSVRSDGTIVLKDNPKFGITVRHQEMKNETKIILHEGYNRWGQSFEPPSLSVLTYNTHLFKNSAAEKAADLVGKNVIYMDMERANAICSKINNYGADIVCLQEVWGIEMQEKIKSLLSPVYPHIYIAPDEGLDFISNQITGTSGLMIASKHPIESHYFEMYRDPNPGSTNVQFEREDSWAKKGVAALMVKVNVPGAGQPLLVRIANTHSFTGISNGEAAHCSEVAAKIAFESFPDRIHPSIVDNLTQWNGIIVEGNGGYFSFTPSDAPPRILAGDLNLHRRNEQLFGNLKELMNGKNVSEAIEQKFPNDPNTEKTFTTYTGDNDLSLALNPSADGEKDRIDYIFYDGANVLELMEAKVIHDWTMGENDFDLSDHYPVYAKFLIRKENIKPQNSFKKYRVEIDACHTSIDNEGTNSKVDIEFYEGNTLVAILNAPEVETNCDEINDNEFELNTRRRITKVVVRNTGDDALFIDEVYLRIDGKEVKHYGADNGGGWCLSTDPNDSNYWKGYLSGTNETCVLFVPFPF
ncbi:MAG: endonuclease/exonuclease/phosphatase family protein [bacterium]|nr:endonuclease/exonuclease/phosphatase family protein [bacterium]